MDEESKKIMAVMERVLKAYSDKIIANLDRRTPPASAVPKGRVRMLRLDTAIEAVREVKLETSVKSHTLARNHLRAEQR